MEVPGRDGVTEPLGERQEVGTETGVDVAEDTALGGEGGDFADLVDNAERVAWRGASEKHGVLGDPRAHGVNIGSEVVSQWSMDDFDVEIVSGFVERGMSGDRDNHLRVSSTLLGACPVAGGL